MMADGVEGKLAQNHSPSKRDSSCSFFLSALSLFLYPSPRFPFGSFLCFLSHTKSFSLFHNREDEDPEYKPLRMAFKDDLDVSLEIH